MSDLFLIAGGAGLGDGLNPCIFMAAAIFIVCGRLVASSAVFANAWRVLFALAYLLGILFFDFGPGEVVAFQKNFILIAKVLYVLLSIWAFVLGILILKEWYVLSRGRALAAQADPGPKAFNGLLAGFMAAALGALLSAMATLWPANKYIIILGNAAFVKGQWYTVMPLLLVYVAVSMWPLWLLWALLSVKDVRPSWLRIIQAVIFLTASSCVALIFL